MLYPKRLRGYRLHIEIVLHLLQSSARHLMIIHARTGAETFV